MEQRSLFCRDIIKGFTLLTDVFFLLLEHVEIMQIIKNCHVMNSQAKNEASMIWWRWTDHSPISYSVRVLNTSQCKALLWFQICPRFLLSYQGRTYKIAPEQTSAHTRTHMYKHTRADMLVHDGPVTLKEKIYIWRWRMWVRMRVYSRNTFDHEEMKRRRGREGMCACVCVREQQSNMRLRDSGGQTLIPPGACWVSLQ